MGSPFSPWGPHYSGENGDPGIPIFMGSPKFYDTGITREPPTNEKWLVLDRGSRKRRRKAERENEEVNYSIIKLNSIIVMFINGSNIIIYSGFASLCVKLAILYPGHSQFFNVARCNIEKLGVAWVRG